MNEWLKKRADDQEWHGKKAGWEHFLHYFA